MKGYEFPVGGFNPIETYSMYSIFKMGIFPKWGWTQHQFEPPPSYEFTWWAKNWTPHHLMIPSTLIVNNPPFPSCWSNQTHSFTASQIHQRQLCRALAECNGENGTGKMRWGIGAVRGIKKKYINLYYIYINTPKMVNFLGCSSDPFEGCWWPPAIRAQVGSLSILGCV